MTGTNTYFQKLMVTNPIREPIVKAAIKTLNLPQKSKGLDVGCGLGYQTLLFVEELGSNYQIIGVDISQEFLNFGKKMVNKFRLRKVVFISFHLNRIHLIGYGVAIVLAIQRQNLTNC